MNGIREMIKRPTLAKRLGMTIDQVRWHTRNDPAFPQAVPLSASGRAVGYFTDEVVAWQTSMSKRRADRLAKQKRPRTSASCAEVK